MELPPDVVLAIREYLREDASLMLFFNNNYKKIDIDDPDLGKNFVTMFRAGGAPSDFINYDEAAITFHCFGSTWTNASKLGRLVVKALKSCHGFHGEHGYISGASVTSFYDNPGTDGHDRFVVTALVRAKAVAPQ